MMSQLINLNETGVPSIGSHRDVETSSQESSSATSIKSPLLFTNLSEHTDCLRLTPVNIKNLTSPLKPPSEELTVRGEEVISYTAYKENFNLISKKLEKLLNELNIIYKEIGYSNTEISTKEKEIFNNLSDSITGFFEQANEERERISSENETSQEILQRILHIIRDPKGTNTIPDLYTRNVIVSNDPSNSPGCGSPKKLTSLLSKRKIFSKAKMYVLQTYSPMLMQFLESSISLKCMMTALGDFRPSEQKWNVDQLLSIIPPLETCKQFQSFFVSNANNYEKINEFIKENRKVLLHTINFNDISETVLHRIQKLASIYEQEHENRIQTLSALGKKTLDLLKYLQFEAENEVDKTLMTTLRSYATLDQTNKRDINASLRVLKKLEKVFNDFKTIEQQRELEKEDYHQKCRQLWEKLKIPQAYVQKFENRNNSLSLDALNSYSEELKRLQEMKKKLIKNLIQDSWIKIQDLWSAMHMSERDTCHFKELFKTINSGSTTLEDDEKVLETCEAEILELEKKYALYKPILKLIEEFKSLQNDKLELERSSRDSSRLLSRNSHKILLQEERTRKRITRYFPTVIQDLAGKLKDFEKDFGSHLIIDGVKFLDVVQEQEAEIISKYPRSRINSFRGPANPKPTKSKPAGVQKSPHKDRKYRRQNPNSKISIQETPMRVTESVNSASLRPSDSCSLPRTSTEIKPFNRYMHATRISSPSKDIKESNLSLEMTKSSPTRIPKLSVLPNFRSNNTLPPHPRQRLSRPALLSQISPNKLNKMKPFTVLSGKQSSAIFPTFATALQQDEKTSLDGAEQNISSTDKENSNLMSLKSPAQITAKKHTTLHSPPEEPDNSLYQITKSPEGKYLLNVHSTTHEDLEGESEDTSMMDDDRFISWKRERFAKMNKCSSNDQEMQSSINWDTDVF